jgi:hypothetical protein
VAVILAVIKKDGEQPWSQYFTWAFFLVASHVLFVGFHRSSWLADVSTYTADTAIT